MTCQSLYAALVFDIMDRNGHTSKASHKRRGVNDTASAARYSASVLKVCGHIHGEGFKEG